MTALGYRHLAGHVLAVGILILTFGFGVYTLSIDVAHHFLRSFDKTVAAFEPNATDAELADLADTRTARAFMLFGRVTGTFD